MLAIDELVVILATRGGAATILDGASLTVDAGETVALVGESGAGKTVMALAVMGLLPEGMSVSAGSVRLLGDELVGAAPTAVQERRGRDVAMIFQDPQSSLHPAFRIGAQVAEAIRAHTKSGTKGEASARAVDLLARVGIPDAQARVRDYPHQLSGGMQQRVMIAMAMANEPHLLIADEATTALDVTVQAQVLDVLRDAQRATRAAMLVVTHDLGVVATIADRVAVMYAGRIVEQGSVADVLGAPAHPYTRGLLAAVPRLTGSRNGGIRTIPGQPPSPFARPEGCAFHPRCPYADALCASEVPLLAPSVHRPPDHRVACHHAEALP